MEEQDPTTNAAREVEKESEATLKEKLRRTQQRLNEAESAKKFMESEAENAQEGKHHANWCAHRHSARTCSLHA